MKTIGKILSIAVLGMSTLAYARASGADLMPIFTHFSDTTQMEGLLSCQGNDMKAGPCALQLQNAANGKIYTLSASDNSEAIAKAMQLLKSGTRKVAAEGTLSGYLFQIDRIEAR